MKLFINLKAAALCSGFICLFFCSKAQNLVPNGDFETYTTCPDFFVNNGTILSIAPPWQSPSSWPYAEYSNSCATDGHSGVPLNCGGTSFQYAHSGNGYAGFFFYSTDNVDIRQYAEVKLNDSLLAGHCYYVSFYVDLVGYAIAGCNNIAAHFSTTYLTSTGIDGLIPASSDIEQYGNPIILDSLNWVKVDGIFTANGGEQYITIGNFKDDAHTDTLRYAGNTYPNLDYIPYYLDDVSVVPVDASNPHAFAGNDTAITQGDSVFIGSLTSGLTTQWYDANGNQIAANVPGFYVHPTASTTYSLRQDVCGIVTYDTVHIDVNPLGIQNVTTDKIKVFPNPSSGVVNISLPVGSDWQVTATDVEGQQVHVEQLSVRSGQMILKLNAATGVYFLRIVNTSTGEASIKKLVLQ